MLLKACEPSEFLERSKMRIDEKGSDASVGSGDSVRWTVSVVTSSAMASSRMPVALSPCMW